jgi:hypothetical protein
MGQSSKIDAPKQCRSDFGRLRRAINALRGAIRRAIRRDVRAFLRWYRGAGRGPPDRPRVRLHSLDAGDRFTLSTDPSAERHQLVPVAHDDPPTVLARDESCRCRDMREIAILNGGSDLVYPVEGGPTMGSSERIDELESIIDGASVALVSTDWGALTVLVAKHLKGAEIRAFFKRTGKVIEAVTVRYILDEELAMRLV